MSKRTKDLKPPAHAETRQSPQAADGQHQTSGSVIQENDSSNMASHPTVSVVPSGPLLCSQCRAKIDPQDVGEAADASKRQKPMSDQVQEEAKDSDSSESKKERV